MWKPSMPPPSRDIPAPTRLRRGIPRKARTRYYDGPVSDHFDGVTFFDPHGMRPKRLRDLLRWRLSGSGEPWPAWVPSPYADRPPPRVEGQELRVSFVGHASFLLQGAGLNLLIDPVWSDRVSPFGFIGPKRVHDPGIAFEALPRIDAVLVSHAHYDHLDVATLSRLASRDAPRVIAPLGNDTVMRRGDPAIAAEAVDWRQRVVLNTDIAVTAVPLRHWSARGLFDRNRTLWAGFVIETPAGRIYHVADSGYGDGYRFREARERYGPAVPARRVADRRLRAALVHARPAHEPARGRGGVPRLRRRTGDRPSSRHVQADRRSNRHAAQGAGAGP
jgi:L-ascorbate metabolism protein UlaG (beta-lactamase superfamily)